MSNICKNSRAAWQKRRRLNAPLLQSEDAKAHVCG